MIEAIIKEIGKIYFEEEPFDEAVEELKGMGAKIITARDLAYSRIKEGYTSSLSEIGSYVKEGVIYIPKQKGVILLRDSLALKSPKKLRRAHWKGDEFFIYKDQAFEYLEKAKDPRDDSAILITDFASIPTNRFGEDERTNWLFKDQAKNYGLFLNERTNWLFKDLNYGLFYVKKGASLHFNNQAYTNKQEEPYANQLWLGLALCGGPFLSGSGLSCCGRVRGVLQEGYSLEMGLYSVDVESGKIRNLGEVLG